MLRTETIERDTFKLLNTLMQDEQLHHFNLVGGTALALYMGHRKSVDLDLFSPINFDIKNLYKHLKDSYDFSSLSSSDATLIGYIKGVKIDFIQYDYTLAQPVLVQDNIRICSMPDIAAMKLVAISQNGTRLKDFVDVAYLSTKMSLNEMVESFEKRYPNTNSMLALKGLSYFNDIDFTSKIELMTGKFKWKAIEKRIYGMIKYPDKVFIQFPIIS